MQDATFGYEYYRELNALRERFAKENPGEHLDDPRNVGYKKQMIRDAGIRVRRSVYQDTLADLLESGVPGITRREKPEFDLVTQQQPLFADDKQRLMYAGSVAGAPLPDDDTFGDLVADPNSDAHEFAVLRQNQYERGGQLRYWDEYLASKPSKLQAGVQGLIINATMGFEGSAQGIAEWVGTAMADIADPQYKYAQGLGVTADQLDLAIARVEKKPPTGLAKFDYARSAEPTEQDRRIYESYMKLRGPVVEGIREDFGNMGRRWARNVTDVILPQSVSNVRNRLVGSNPEEPIDIREDIGRGGGGAFVKTMEMTGSALGVMPYSVPAMATRNPRLAAALTSPFFAMGHSEAWNRRMRIYEQQAAEAEAAGMPAPPRPTFGELKQQANWGGLIEFGSEFTIDRLQVALPGIANRLSRRLPNVAGQGAESISKSADALLDSLSRRRGPIGLAKGAAVVAAGGATESIEEAIPELGKEVTDPFYIPEGYENDFFSAQTAENMGTGFIAGTLFGGAQQAFGKEARMRRAEQRKFKKAAEGATSTVVGAITDKASRILQQRFAANAVVAKGASMAAHQVAEIAANKRMAMFVNPEMADVTLTDDVREQMAQNGITDKPIGRINGMDVYAQVGMVDDVASYIEEGDIAGLTGYPELMQPGMSMAGAIVVRNKARQIVDAIPFSDSKAAEDARPSVEHTAALSGSTVEIVNADGLASLSEALELQVDADATMRKMTPPSKRGLLPQAKARGIEALRIEMSEDALGTKAAGKADEQFSSPLLTMAEIGSATNKDVEVVTEVSEVPQSQLTEAERNIGKTTGANPVILDAKVTYKITRPDGKVDVYERSTANNGGYVGEVSPDGLFLIRDNGTAFTRRNAIMLALHEMRHALVGKNRGAAAYLAKLLYLDPAFAMRGGIEYMREYENVKSLATGKSGALVGIDDDAAAIAYYQGIHAAALSVLQDEAGYARALKTKNDPNATEQDRYVAETRIEQQAQAQSDLREVERFAEESLANVPNRAIGQVGSRALEWEGVLKDSNERSMRKFVAWFSHVLARNGYAGPEARQALYELQQRIKGVDDHRLKIQQQMAAEIEKKYRDDLMKHAEMKAQAAPQVPQQVQPSAQQPVQQPQPAAQPQPTQTSLSLRPRPSAEPGGVALPGGDRDEQIMAASQRLAEISALPDEQKPAALASVVGLIANVLPLLTQTQASLGSTGRGAAAGGVRTPTIPPPSAAVEEQESAAPTPAPMGEAERQVVERQRAEPMLSLRNPNPRVEELVQSSEFLDTRGFGPHTHPKDSTEDIDEMAAVEAIGAAEVPPKYTRSNEEFDYLLGAVESLGIAKSNTVPEYYAFLEKLGNALSTGLASTDDVVVAAKRNGYQGFRGDLAIEQEQTVTQNDIEKVIDVNFSLRPEMRKTWEQTSKAVDDGMLTTVYNGTPSGLMQFDADRMGQTDRPVDVGAATTSEFSDGLWFTDNKTAAMKGAGFVGQAGETRVDARTNVAKAINLLTSQLASRLPKRIADRFEQNAGVPISEYRVAPENLVERDRSYEDEIDNHRRFLMEMTGNDPVATAAIDQAIKSAPIIGAAQQLSGGGGTVTAANLNLENPIVRSVSRDAPFIMQAEDAISEMRRGGNDGVIFEMPDGERRYFATKPSQVATIGAARDVREASMLSLRPGVKKNLKEAARIEGAMELAKSKKWKKGIDLKRAMQDKVEQAAAKENVDLKQWNEDTKQHLINVGLSDAEYALAQNPQAVGWYDIKTRIALAVASLIHPEIAVDPNARFAYVYAVAVTSNGLRVMQNFSLADKVYRNYKQTGLMDPGMAVGTQADGMKAALEQFNILKNRWGLDKFRQFMVTNFKVSELKTLGKDFVPSGEAIDAEVRGASIIGPKIGNGFFANLNGLFDALTMDRWFVRTWSRWTGTLVDRRPEVISEAVSRFSEAVASLPAASRTLIDSLAPKGLSAATPLEQGLELAKFFSKEENRQAVAGDPALNELRLAANRVKAAESGEKESPSGAAERQQMREVMEEILKRLRKNPKYRDLTMADLQAVYWYMEKRLYENAKVKVADKSDEGYADEEAPDYANASIAVARDLGIDQAKIDEKVKETNGLAAATRPTGDTTRIQRQRGLTVHAEQLAGDKDAFVKSGAIRNAAAARQAGDPSFRYQQRGRGNVAGDGLLTRNRDLVAAVWAPGQKLKNALSAAGINAPRFGELVPGKKSAKLFHAAITKAKAKHRFGSSVYAYSVSDYEGMRLFISEDGSTGVAIKPDGDMVSVFSSSKDSQGRAAVELALVNGATKGDAFDTALPRLYSDHGFRVVSRLAWDESQAPSDWNKETYKRFNNGMPDVVFMVHDPNYSGNYEKTDGTPAGDYETAVKMQSNELDAVKKMQNLASVPVKSTDETDAMFSMRRGLPGVRDEAMLRYIDKFDELLRYQREAEARGINIPPILNPYIGARLLSGRLGAMQQEAERDYADLLRRMHLDGVTLAEMDEFLTAQHAEERNIYVATINPAFPDGGSGMFTGDARNIIQAAVNSGRFGMLNGYAEEWRQMLRDALNERLANGLINRQTYDNLTARYQNYVPLRGAPVQPNDEDFLDFGEAGGRGLSTTGRGLPASMGRRSEAEAVTSQVGYVHEDTFRRIERNRIGQSFLHLVQAVNDPNMAEVVRPTRRAIVPTYAVAPGGGRVRTGEEVRVIHDPAWMTDQRHFGLYTDRALTINGHNYEPGDLIVIRINNRRLADAMTSPSLELRSFERGLRHVNNAWRFMTTGLGNPAFPIANMFRDVLTGAINNYAARGAADTLGMMRRWSGAFRNVFVDSWNGGAPTGAYGDFVRSGGDQLYWRPNDLEVKRADFDAIAERVARRDPNDRTLARTLFGWYPAFFEAAEKATRVAQYEQRIATGASEAEAALAARDLTIDFAKGGQAKPVLNTWYMFLNAGLQGNVNLLRSIQSAPGTVPALIGLGFANAALARFMGGDDEETKQANVDNIPEYERTSNMYFFDPRGTGKYVKVPLPYGYNVFFSMGARMADAVYGRKTSSDVLNGTLVDALNAFNPMGGSGIKSGGTALVAAAVPTMARPAIELLGNEDFAGRPIAPTVFDRFPGPRSQNAFDGTPEGYKRFAETVNAMTGGDEFEAGMIDASPNHIQYLLGYYFSGTGRLLDRVYKAALSNEEVTANDLPVMRSFVGDARNDTRALSQNFYGLLEEIAPARRRLDFAMDEANPLADRQRVAREISEGEVANADWMKLYEKELTKLRKQLKTATPEQRDAIMEVRRKVLKAAVAKKNELTDIGLGVD